MAKVLRAIVAEDMHHVRQFIRSYCEEDGIVIVAETGNGTQVLSLVQAYKPDLIVLDIELEGITGIEAAREIRRIPAYSPHIIFVTGSTDATNIMVAVNEVGAYYVVKPLLRDRWNLAIHKIIKAFEEASSTDQSSEMEAALSDPPSSRSSTCLKLQTSHKEIPITEESILMVEKEISKKYVNIYLTNGEVLKIMATITEINNLTSDYIVETIRGYLVNIRHVTDVSKENVPIENTLRRQTIHFHGTDLTAPLGRAQEKSFIERLNRFKPSKPQ